MQNQLHFLASWFSQMIAHICLLHVNYSLYAISPVVHMWLLPGLFGKTPALKTKSFSRALSSPWP